MEKRERLSQARGRAVDEEVSGIHVAVWPLPARARDDDAALKGPGSEESVQQVLAVVGPRVLARFPRLVRSERAALLETVAARLQHERPPPGALMEAHVRRAVFCEAVAVDRRRFADELDVTPERLHRLLAHTQQRFAALTLREQSVLRAIFTLDDVAEEDEVGKVVLHAAVAYQMRWNTAHQHLSRSWRKLCEGGLARWAPEWRAAHRFVCDPPSVELWAAARAYLDACSGRGIHGDPAFEAWQRAHEDHFAWFGEWKKQSAVATQRWREVVLHLDEGRLRPRDLEASLLAACSDLGMDRWLVPAKLRQQSWRDLLGEAPRPAPEARDAWRALLRAHPFDPEVEAAFRDLEREAALVEIAGVELEAAYHRLLAAAERRSVEGVRAKDELRSLLAASRWA